MKKILHITCSPRGTASESERLSRRIVDRLLQSERLAMVVRRHLGDGSLAHVDRDYATSQSSSHDVSRDGSMAQSETLIRELEEADYVVIGTPMHNLAVPSVLKAWIDHIVRARRTFEISAAGKIGLLHDRPVFIAVASGGWFAGERARQPDFLTPYLRAILATIGLHDVTFFAVQGTSAAPERVAETRESTERELQAHFAGVDVTGLIA
ncbi:NAD(P)H-dependent oxidoreductase [Lysobacter arenosi]|uniref:FMN dependent NADH:quinone oxidoreductase n=1 Tax=Lysobacter arenosi TaxID=2795387 RepID=A0ABX7RD31_9GAMM|nr:NAD(P)H-dependent oxidoreductase [Lysobacter arenosi]QSX75304.1 NAD(P)H-dependent oxidoreductase [Lysobacter arenosi]